MSLWGSILGTASLILYHNLNFKFSRFVFKPCQFSQDPAISWVEIKQTKTFQHGLTCQWCLFSDPKLPQEVGEGPEMSRMLEIWGAWIIWLLKEGNSLDSMLECAFSLLYIFLLGDPIRSHGFNYVLNTVRFQMCPYSPFLGVRQTEFCLSNGIHFHMCLYNDPLTEHAEHMQACFLLLFSITLQDYEKQLQEIFIYYPI